MAIVKFEDEDEPFREWRMKHPPGFVVNVDLGMSDRHGTRIHRADGQSLAPAPAGREADRELHQRVPDPRPDIDDWAVGELGCGLKEPRCKLCNPSSPA
jgi:hypothetical protein